MFNLFVKKVKLNFCILGGLKVDNGPPYL